MLICKLAMAASAVVLVSFAGCSFLLVDRPPPNPASLRYFDCTSSYLAPALDLTLGGLLGLGMMGSASEGTAKSEAIAEGTLVVGAALASATYGFLHASHCRDAKLALAERMMEPPQSAPPPPRLFPPPRGGAAPPSPPVFRDPWLAEGAPPGDGNQRAGGNPAPPPAPSAAPPASSAPLPRTERVPSPDAGAADR